MPLVGFRHLVVRAIARSHVTARWLSATFVVAITTLVAACAGETKPGFEPGSGPGPGFFPVQPVSQQGQYVFDFYPVIFWIAVGVFVLVEGLLIWIVLRYRRRPTDAELPVQTHGNNVLEIVWTLIPALIVTALFAFTVDTLGKVETASNPTDNPGLTIDVTGFQWQWTFEYREQGVSLTGTGSQGPTMALPVGEKVRIRLHSADTDVIHSFYVPQFLYKKDAIPGRTNEFDVLVQQPGTFAGQCAEFCGLGHADMRFTVEAMSRADFDAWLAEQQQPQPSPSALPSGAPVVSLTSIGVIEGFNPTELSVAADTAWSVQLTNADPAVPHNFSIRSANADGSDWVGTPNAEGGGSAVYQPPALSAADYEFFCSLHPNMIGTLHVGQ